MQTTEQQSSSFWSKFLPKTGQETGNDSLSFLFWALLFSLCGVLLIVLFTFKTWQPLAMAGMLGAGAFSAGALLGFLFGIPRSNQQELPVPPPANGTPESQTQPVSTYRANTNLEQVSDWLTKILVGVTLVQLDTIADKFYSFSSIFGPFLVDSDEARGSAFAKLIIIFFGICGFMAGYLITRIYLTREFANVEIGLGQLFQQVDRANDAVERITEQEKVDRGAVELTWKLLTVPDLEIAEEKVLNAIKGTSLPTRRQIYFNAERQRSELWDSPDAVSRKRIRQIVPIFQALTLISENPAHADDEREMAHRYYANLGYSLKDQDPPELERALEALDNAVSHRDKNKTVGYRIYEFNRALCTAHFWQTAKHQKKDLTELNRKIRKDLEAAAEHPYLFDQTFRIWRKSTTARHGGNALQDWLKDYFPESKFPDRSKDSFRKALGIESDADD